MNTKSELKDALEKVITIHNTMSEPQSNVLIEDMCDRRDFDNNNTFAYRNDTYKISLYCHTFSSCAAVYSNEAFTYDGDIVNFEDIVALYDSICEWESI